MVGSVISQATMGLKPGPRRRWCRAGAPGREDAGGTRRGVGPTEAVCVGPMGSGGQDFSVLRPHGHADGQGGADEDVLAAGVGALVDAHHRPGPVIGEPHVDGGGDRSHHRGGENRP